MNCREAEHQILAERDGALDETQRAALASHLAGCAECRRRRDDLEGVVRAWRWDDATVSVPDAGLEWRKLARRLENPEQTRRSVVGWLALPAALGAAAVVALYVSPGHESTPTPAPAPAVASAEANVAATPPVSSTVVYVDEKSGWTFVWAPEPAANGQHI